MLADIGNKVLSIRIKDCLHCQLFVYNSTIPIWWLLIYQNSDTKQKHQQEKTTRHHNYIGTLWVQQLYPSSLGRICKLKIVTNIFQTWLRNSLFKHFIINRHLYFKPFNRSNSRYRSVILVYRVFHLEMTKWKSEMIKIFMYLKCLQNIC